MRRTLLLVIACCAAFAQEDPRARAREKEIEAENALDAGRREDALKLLKEAADLRAGVAAPEAPPPEAKAPANAKGVAEALSELDAAIAKGDAAAVKAAAERARDLLAGWQASLEKRERALAAGAPLEKRLAGIEKRIDEILGKVGG
jgi:hypothetical protein